jgi:hypothetical protein
MNQQAKKSLKIAVMVWGIFLFIAVIVGGLAYFSNFQGPNFMSTKSTIGK